MTMGSACEPSSWSLSAKLSRQDFEGTRPTIERALGVIKLVGWLGAPLTATALLLLSKIH